LIRLPTRTCSAAGSRPTQHIAGRPQPPQTETLERLRSLPVDERALRERRGFEHTRRLARACCTGVTGFATRTVPTRRVAVADRRRQHAHASRFGDRCAVVQQPGRFRYGAFPRFLDGEQLRVVAETQSPPSASITARPHGHAFLNDHRDLLSRATRVSAHPIPRGLGARHAPAHHRALRAPPEIRPATRGRNAESACGRRRITLTSRGISHATLRTFRRERTAAEPRTSPHRAARIRTGHSPLRTTVGRAS